MRHDIPLAIFVNLSDRYLLIQALIGSIFPNQGYGIPFLIPTREKTIMGVVATKKFGHKREERQ
jgi:hypothetical protein